MSLLGANARDKVTLQFGTLGAGNHFVEVCEDSDENVWLLLHSGSRGIGNMLATAHVADAKIHCDLEGIALEDKDFAYFHAGTREAEAYLADMLWAQAYAYSQREAMMDNLIEAVSLRAGRDWNIKKRINCHHNYAEQRPDGAWLTRKGAIDASVGRMGIIPGSMGAATYIVRGKGNAESYHTSPHGAGRILGRKQAKRSLDVAEFKKQMEGKTWLDRDAAALLDEAPSAYKPIETVIADSAELVEPVTVLGQFVNYKGL
jgi:RNA-splicing ligase RtcB